MTHDSRATSAAAAKAAATIRPMAKKRVRSSVRKIAASASSGKAHSIAAAHRVPRATHTHAATTATTSARSLSTQHFFRGITGELRVESLDGFRRESGAIDQPRVAAQTHVAHAVAIESEAHLQRDPAARQHRDRGPDLAEQRADD